MGRGRFHKHEVRRVRDGAVMDWTTCFVLVPDKDPAARVALAAYAEAVVGANPVLARDLWRWLEGFRDAAAAALWSEGEDRLKGRGTDASS